ncbi:MAG: N-acetyl-alpha-D-muramate 1-phosphate uridylyltransferase [Acidimicrobiaceae bacterium]
MLGAGLGLRLKPLTSLRPKVLCPVGDRPLVDHALERFIDVTEALAVNVHHHRSLLESHLAGRVHLSMEVEEPLGTAGGLGLLRDWIDHRPVVVVNGDTYCPSSVAPLLDGWDGERIRVLVPGGAPFGPGTEIAGCVMPWSEVKTFAPVPTGLYERSWTRAAQEARLEVVELPEDAVCIDCGTPSQYLAANLNWSGGESVVGAGAIVEGEINECVIWPGAHVRPEEHLTRAIRAHEHVTVLVR